MDKRGPRPVEQERLPKLSSTASFHGSMSSKGSKVAKDIRRVKLTVSTDRNPGGDA